MKNILTIIFLFICICAHAQDSKMTPKKMKGYAGETLTNAGNPIVQTQPSMNVYNDYGWLRGFSMVPSWGARIEEAWWFYDSKRMREEVALARKVHANCIRLWIDFTAWNADPEKITERFLDAVAAIDEAGMKTMPCLFNRWHDSQYDYGGLYMENIVKKGWEGPMLEYVRTLVKPLAEDPRVLIWDICNEPQAHLHGFEPENVEAGLEVKFFEKVAETIRSCGAKQPITIGLVTAGQIEGYAHFIDVLCAHPYAHDKEKLKEMILGFKKVQAKYHKPMLVNECIPGSLSDTTRAEVVKYYTELLSEAGFGWMGWALKEGKAISTRRDRHDGNGINGEGFHPFFTRQGNLRGGLEFMTKKPLKPVPW